MLRKVLCPLTPRIFHSCRSASGTRANGSAASICLKQVRGVGPQRLDPFSQSHRRHAVLAGLEHVAIKNLWLTIHQTNGRPGPRGNVRQRRRAQTMLGGLRHHGLVNQHFGKLFIGLGCVGHDQLQRFLVRGILGGESGAEHLFKLTGLQRGFLFQLPLFIHQSAIRIRINAIKALLPGGNLLQQVDVALAHLVELRITVPVQMPGTIALDVMRFQVSGDLRFRCIIVFQGHKVYSVVVRICSAAEAAEAAAAAGVLAVCKAPAKRA